MKIRALHWALLIVGSIFLGSSVILAVFFSYPQFYTAFAFGSWLVLDWLDWRLNGTSILAYFFNHRHRDAFAAFFAAATIFCLVVDYGYGVRLSGAWVWRGYGWVQYLRMYLVMNASYILGMYELFRVVRSLLGRFISPRHLLPLRASLALQGRLERALVMLGVFCLLAPLYALIFDTRKFLEFAMILPFCGMLLLADGLTGLLGGRPILGEFIRLNRLQWAAAFGTALAAAAITETLNLFGGEWRYANMPFPWLQIFGIPMAVFVGWVPLVFGAIALINLTQRADRMWDAAHAAALPAKK